MTLTSADAALYRALNSFVEPVVRAGLGSPCVISPAGLIVLETRGRESGLPRRVTLVGMLIGGYVVAGTFRVGRSQWLRNVRHTPDVRYWLGGQEHEARAYVVMPGDDVPDVELESARLVAQALRIPAATLGAAFVVLEPA
jgi:hypothetical protein